MMHATKILTATIGVICGISGLEHGFFETLQGNIAPKFHIINGSRMIYAIEDAQRFWKYGYE